MITFLDFPNNEINGKWQYGHDDPEEREEDPVLPDVFHEPVPAPPNVDCNWWEIINT